MEKELIFYEHHFENAVRHELLIYDRPITDSDALTIFDLDCSDFSFDRRDYDTLATFKNLDCLSINTRANELNFLKALPMLQELNLETWSSDNIVDFNHFSHLEHLRGLFVSGGDISDIQFENLDGLVALKKLENLTLHEFGTVDLSPLRRMPWLKGLYCGYANKVYDIDAISALINLDALTLINVKMENLDFLDRFPDSLIVELTGIKVLSGINHDKLARFYKGDFEDIESPY